MRPFLAICLALAALSGCEEPQYDTSTPQAALDSMYQMVLDEHPELLGRMIHIEARDVTFDDGVTEASAIAEVIDKASGMLGQLYAVALKVRARFPEQVQTELNRAADAAGRNDIDFVREFLANPFGLVDEQRRRVTVEDLGDGTAAILIDGQPAFGFGLQMRDIDGQWKIDVPIDLLQKFRPDTRHEWSVIASMMLTLENALAQFEAELERGEFRDLNHASARAGRLLGERAFVQGMIYRGMKQNAQSAANGER